jgi:hypothetical protein
MESGPPEKKFYLPEMWAVLKRCFAFAELMELQ